MLPDALFLNVHMYGIMVAVGILFAFGVIVWYGKKLAVPEKTVDFVFYDGILAVLVGFGAAALFQALYEYIENPEKGFHISGSITFLGGLLGGAACFLLGYLLWHKKLPAGKGMRDMFTILPCSITVAHGFGRIGCFFAGCCYGKVTDSWLGVKFPRLPQPVHPTQLYEAAFLFILFAVLSWLVLTKKGKFNFPIYMMAYGVFRFAIEYLRDDDRGAWIGSLTPSQFWSVVMVLGGIGLLVWFILRDKREAAAADTPNEEEDVPAEESPAAEKTDGEDK